MNLNQLEKKLLCFLGDNNRTAKIIADEIGIEKVFSESSPKEKFEKVRELSKETDVMMIGDGINDSPSLKLASIGVSVSNGTDISSDSSDIILLSDDMKKVPYLFKLGNRTIKIIKENLFWAFFYNILMVPLASGLFKISLNPTIASLAMVFSSLTVVLNSLRLRKV